MPLGEEVMSNRNVRAQGKSVDQNLEEMALWYLSECPDASKSPPTVVYNDKAVFKDRPAKTWHLEPILPGVNPILVSFQLGDSWVLSLEPMTQKLIGG